MLPSFATNPHGHALCPESVSRLFSSQDIASHDDCGVEIATVRFVAGLLWTVLLVCSSTKKPEVSMSTC